MPWARMLTEMQAKSEALWDLLRTQGVPNIAIGDLGNRDRHGHHC